MKNQDLAVLKLVAASLKGRGRAQVLRRLASEIEGRTAAPIPWTNEILPVLKDFVWESIREVASSYEGYNTKMEAPGGRGYTFGSGTNGGFGGSTLTNLSKIDGAGEFPQDPQLEAALRRAISRAQAAYDAGEDSEDIDDALGEETVALRLGAFYFAPDSYKGNGKHIIEVFALADLDGPYLLTKSIPTYTEEFEVASSKDLKSLLRVHMAKALHSLM